MILVDANLLLYATISSYAQHARAHAWLDERLNDRTRVGLPWVSLLAFVRVAINHRLFPRPYSFDQAWQQVREWLDVPCVWTPSPTEHHRAAFERVSSGAGVTPKLVTDVHLAALAIEHGLTLCSADADFGRFRDLRWENPLADTA